jgi:hypothetical protein
MAIKTFTDNTTLPASDINTYLTNSGLVYVTSATVGTGVSSVTVSSAFNSTYDAYKIVATGVAINTGAGNSTSLQLTGLTTGYYAAIVYCLWSSTTVVGSTDNNQAAWNFAGSHSTDGLVLNCDIVNPFLAIPTTLNNGSYASHLGGSVNGKQTSSTSTSGFTVTTPGSTMTGGKITVYGYRKA